MSAPGVDGEGGTTGAALPLAASVASVACSAHHSTLHSVVIVYLWVSVCPARHQVQCLPSLGPGLQVTFCKFWWIMGRCYEQKHTHVPLLPAPPQPPSHRIGDLASSLGPRSSQSRLPEPLLLLPSVPRCPEVSGSLTSSSLGVWVTVSTAPENRMCELARGHCTWARGHVFAEAVSLITKGPGGLVGG